MIDFLGSPEVLPFTVALALMLMIGAVEALGIGASAAHVDAGLDVQPGAHLLGWLGFGAVPLLILLVIFLALFSLVGLIGQRLAAELLGSPLSAWLAAPAAALLSMPLLGATARAAARVMPRDETTAVGRDSLIGKRATVTVGVARVDAPARAIVRDHHGQQHHVMVVPFSEGTEAKQGQALLLVRREGELFIGLAEGETLELSLEDRPQFFR
jgi:membrane protein implicated in regulation of membrane protease activity